MIHYRFLLEELHHGGKQAVTFMVCVALSIATLTALNSFGRDVRGTLIDEARALQGGDIIIHAHQPLSDRLVDAIDALAGDGRLSRQNTLEFYTVALAETDSTPLLSAVKAVEPAYPYFGTVGLASGAVLSEALKPGTVIVGREVLDRLGLQVGDRLRIGGALFTITDVVQFESMRPVSFLSFGPRIFMAMTDLDRLGLVGRGSRVQHELLIRLTDPAEADSLVETLRASATPRLERIETAQNARSRVKTFFDNLLFFLSCISILTLLLSGIGMQGCLSAMLYRKQEVIAAAKAFGASSRFLVSHYLAMVLMMGAFGSIVGIGLGYLIKRMLPLLFSGLIPADLSHALHPADALESVVLGILVAVVFTLLPLQRLGSIKPVMIFRREQNPANRRAAPLAAGLVCGLFLFLLVLRQLADIKIGLLFVAGLALLIGAVFAAASAVLWLLKRSAPPTLTMRQAAKSLIRPGNASRSIMITLTAAIAALLVIFLIKLNLFATFIQSYPEDAPNLFCIDIQKDQQDRFRSLAGDGVTLFPVIRARLLSINGDKIDPEKERLRKSDNLGREFNLTYRTVLLDDEIIIDGKSLFDGRETLSPGVAAVSVLDTIAEIGTISLHDRLRFNIQGVELDAEVTSIRSRTESRLYPFFYFVFEPPILEDAPQTFFAALHLPKDEIPRMISAITAEMPNVSTINVADMAERFGRLMERLSVIVTFFAAFSIVAGGLILISAIFATRLDRIREAVYYKVLGADSSFVLRVLAWEHALLALLSSIMAVGFAEAAAWLICRYLFDIVYDPYWPVALLTVVSAVLLVVLVGLAGSISIVRHKPAEFLRRQSSG